MTTKTAKKPKKPVTLTTTAQDEQRKKNEGPSARCDFRIPMVLVPAFDRKMIEMGFKNRQQLVLHLIREAVWRAEEAKKSASVPPDGAVRMSSEG